MNYALISSARNEEKFIALTLDSVTRQTKLPERWVIVDDGSTDRTGEIADSYAKNFPWISVIHNPRREGRSFAAKANNVNAAFAKLEVERVDFEVVGNLDTDTNFAPDYMEFVLQKMAADPKLGCAGTPFTQDGGYDSTKDSFEGENYVAGPIQLFRRECFREIGGYVANPAGGVDWIAVMTARLKGWTVHSFADKRYHHHRSMGTAERGEVKALFSYGEKDYYLGNSPLWEVLRCTFRLAKKPYLVGGLALFAGFSWAAIRRVKRPVSDELVRFHRADQMNKLKNIFRSLLRLKKVDNFCVVNEAKETN
jgi:glycosyltransferase involved in cell wall biosynthesis